MLDIISVGNIELIRNDTLRSLILSLGSKIEDIKELQRLNNELLNANAIPYLYEHFAYTKMDSRFNIFDVDWPKGRFDSDLNYMFNDRKFESILDDIIYRHLTIRRDIDVLVKEIQLALHLINRELKN
jgi:hypothetical protein